MSREAWGDPPEAQQPPECCPNCGSSFHMHGCPLCDMDKRRIAVTAERDALRAELSQHAGDWNRVHNALKDAGVHPGRTDDHLSDVIGWLAKQRDDAIAALNANPIGEVVIGEEGTTKGWTVIKWRADLPPVSVGTKLYAAPAPTAQPVQPERSAKGLTVQADADSFGGITSKALRDWAADVSAGGRKSLSAKMREAGFTLRDRRLTCDECGAKFTAQMAPLHECKTKGDTK